MNNALSVKLVANFQDAVASTREALAQQGFGVLTEIDVTATLKAKLGVDLENYLILGACNPALAYQAINIDRQIGLLLPCNIVVRDTPEDPGTVLVEAVDPTILVQISGEPALEAIADAVTAKLGAVIAALTARCG